MAVRKKEAQARLKINELLKNAGWILPDGQDDQNANVTVEPNIKQSGDLGDDFEKTTNGFVDYLLLNPDRYPLAVLEAKSESKSPLDGKEQARRYANTLNARFIILSNGNLHYFWDLETGNPEIIREFPTQQSLLSRTTFKPQPQALYKETIGDDYIALSQEASLVNDNRWKSDIEYKRQILLEKPELRLLRPYQLKAVQALQAAARENKQRFLFEMATGTGKTLLSAAVIKLFLRSGNAKRVLFLVDRLELEEQAHKNLNKYLHSDYTVVVYKHNQDDWMKAEVVVSTVQSLLANYKYRKNFCPTDFDLLVSDEAHRSMSGDSRAVFEYFIGYKLGLTATPKDYLKNIDHKELSERDQRKLEKRLLLDTYTTFGCQNSEPTFRYSVADGVADNYLVEVFAIDARTEITTDLLSEKGYAQVKQDEDGSLEDIIYAGKDFEKKFFSENTNVAFCNGFLQEALKDPISGEIGKSIVFCVSQAHARKITQILNQLAHKLWPDKYNSDFAVQVTSNIDGSQGYARQFSNNNLTGRSRFLEGYRSSKTRVCVTVNMMTTGYDCPDILNLCLMRPIFSPTDFVQIRGRGTRRHTFKYVNERKEEKRVEKENFYLFDFFANCEYFEEKFDYDKPLSISLASFGATVFTPVASSKETEIHDPDKIKTSTPLQYPDGMKVDREMWGQARKEISENSDLKECIRANQWDRAEYIIRTEYEDKPKYFLNLRKIQKIENLDRRLNWREVLQYIFGHIEYFPVRTEVIDEEIGKFISIYKPDEALVSHIRNYMHAYITDTDFRKIIDEGNYAELNNHSGFDMEEFRALDNQWRTKIPEYIKDYVNLNTFMD